MVCGNHSATNNRVRRFLLPLIFNAGSTSRFAVLCARSIVEAIREDHVVVCFEGDAIEGDAEVTETLASNPGPVGSSAPLVHDYCV